MNQGRDMDNRELIDRLRRDLSMSLYANHADLWSEVEHQRRHAALALERAEAELAKYRSAPTMGYRYEFANGGAVVGQYMIDAGQWPVDDKPTAIHELIIRPEAP